MPSRLVLIVVSRSSEATKTFGTRSLPWPSRRDFRRCLASFPRLNQHLGIRSVRKAREHFPRGSSDGRAYPGCITYQISKIQHPTISFVYHIKVLGSLLWKNGIQPGSFCLEEIFMASCPSTSLLVIQSPTTFNPRGLKVNEVLFNNPLRCEELAFLKNP
jgi:hypothetical protein